jgi:cytochrome c-type biogenesis protein CcmE
MRRRAKWIIAAAVLMAVAGGTAYGVSSMVNRAATGHITVDQLRYLDQSALSQPLRVGGKVQPGSINWDPGTGAVRFSLAEGSDELDVLFVGILPDDFKPGASLIVEGSYDSSGAFVARTAITQGSALCKACH